MRVVATVGSAMRRTTQQPRVALPARWHTLPHPVRWLTASILGGTLIAIGAVLLVLPGPGIALLLAGLLVLGTEFAWARRLRRHLTRHTAAATTHLTGRIRRIRTPQRGRTP
jgi:drug/metabolite transporter (DMT)-like permease